MFTIFHFAVYSFYIDIGKWWWQYILCNNLPCTIGGQHLSGGFRNVVNVTRKWNIALLALPATTVYRFHLSVTSLHCARCLSARENTYTKDRVGWGLHVALFCPYCISINTNAQIACTNFSLSVYASIHHSLKKMSPNPTMWIQIVKHWFMFDGIPYLSQGYLNLYRLSFPEMRFVHDIYSWIPWYIWTFNFDYLV